MSLNLAALLKTTKPVSTYTLTAYQLKQDYELEAKDHKSAEEFKAELIAEGYKCNKRGMFKLKRCL